MVVRSTFTEDLPPLATILEQACCQNHEGSSHIKSLPYLFQCRMICNIAKGYRSIGQHCTYSHDHSNPTYPLD